MDNEELLFYEEDTGEDPLQMAFFIMPGHALKSLRDEIEIQGGESLANDMLYRYGIRCGEGMVTRMGMKCDTLEEIATTIPGLWAGVGLGRISVEEVSEDHIKLRFHESVESLALAKPQKPLCHFTRGYLQGMAMGLSGLDYNVDEIQCSEDWSETCFVITLGTEYFKPVKEQAASTETVEPQAETGIRLERGLAYLYEAEDPDGAYKLFVDELWKPFDQDDRPDERWPDITESIERLRPLASEAVLALFKQTMAEEVEQAFGKILDEQGRRRS